MKYFGTDGIRRIANTELTPKFVFKVAQAGAKVLTKEINGQKKPRIIIGRDTRISGSIIENAMAAGFLSYGADVELVGVVPTPAIAYLTKSTNADMSVMISASHNSFEYNGIKFFSNKGTKIPDKIEEEIEKYIDNEELLNIELNHNELGVSKNEPELIEKYFEFITNIFKKDIEKNNREDFIVGIDTANGATYKIAEKIFKELGIKYKIINNEPDGININKDCGSTHLEQLKKFVVDNKLSMGIAYDGDGDRCLTVDEKGEEVNGDIIIAIIADYMNKRNELKNNRVVATVMSNMGLMKFGEKNNIEIAQTKVGDRYVLEEMLKNGDNLGGEQSGHIILADYNLTGDGIATSLMITKILLEKGIKFSELCKIIDIYPQTLVNVRVDRFDMDSYPEINEINKKTEKELNGEGRILIRKSGTEPLIRVMIEGKDINYIEKAANDIANVIKEKLTDNQ